MKYSKKFEKDYKWYTSIAHLFCFDGASCYINKKGVDLIRYSTKGKTAKECFYLYDSNGVIKDTCEPKELETLYRTKGSVNLHIKMYAEDRAKGVLPRMVFDQMCIEFNAPSWFVDAVENQKVKYYD